jgi:hypothetical protein
MNAFISWSGKRELLIAKAFKEWLATLAPEISSFMSPDLPKGQAWFDTLAKELKGAGIAFMCLAPPRVASEWQLVEAGAIWKAAKKGGLFPLSFRVPKTDIPEPVRAFQLTQFDKEDFKRLAKDVAKLARPNPAWTPEHEQVFEQSWPKFAAGVENALRQPDDGVHTTRGFIHEVAGGWWELVNSGSGKTRLSWMLFQPSADGTGLTIEGRGFGAGASDASRWRTDLVSVNAAPAQPEMEYYWEGRHPGKSKEAELLYGGKCWLRFMISPDGSINQGTGEFKDVCMDEARPPTTKMVDLEKATNDETSVMTGKDEGKRRAKADEKLKDLRKRFSAGRRSNKKPSAVSK